MISISLDMDKALHNYNDMIKRAENQRKVMQVIGSKAFKECVSHFDTETGSERPWPKLATSTLRARGSSKTTTRYKKGASSSLATKRASGGKKVYGKGASSSLRILQVTGNLRGKTNFRVVADNEAHVYNNVPYANYHQQTNGTGKGIIPKRDFLWLSPETREILAKVLTGYIVRNET